VNGWKILLIGRTGQLGWELQRTLATLGTVVALEHDSTPAADLAKPGSLRGLVRALAPDLIVNAAAYTAVDRAESEPELAMAVNGTAPGVLAEEAARLKVALVHYSTEYVFDGSKDGAWTEEDVPAPLNVYGKTKLAGEQAIQASGCAHLIFRTSWVYAARGHNFLRTMLRLAAERDALNIVADQIGTPNWARWLAGATAHALTVARGPTPRAPAEALTPCSGLYHLSCAGATSWHGFAERIFALHPPARPVTVNPIATRDYPTPAQRPANSRLDTARLTRAFGIHTPAWDELLSLCLAELP
jgi:dTDP-4-dehydrorhamnose reductase